MSFKCGFFFPQKLYHISERCLNSLNEQYAVILCCRRRRRCPRRCGYCCCSNLVIDINASFSHESYFNRMKKLTNANVLTHSIPIQINFMGYFTSFYHLTWFENGVRHYKIRAHSLSTHRVCVCVWRDFRFNTILANESKGEKRKNPKNKKHRENCFGSTSRTKKKKTLSHHVYWLKTHWIESRAPCMRITKTI